MNLRRILQGLALCLFVVFYSNNAQAQQVQLAAINAEGLIQIGANHPFVVSQYEFSMDPINAQSPADANSKLRKYREEGFTFSYDMSSNMATMNVDISTMYDQTSVPVSVFNDKLRAIHKLRR